MSDALGLLNDAQKHPETGFNVILYNLRYLTNPVSALMLITLFSVTIIINTIDTNI